MEKSGATDQPQEKKPTKKICCACPETKVCHWTLFLLNLWLPIEYVFCYGTVESERRVHCSARPRFRRVSETDRGSQSVP